MLLLNCTHFPHLCVIPLYIFDALVTLTDTLIFIFFGPLEQVGAFVFVFEPLQIKNKDDKHVKSLRLYSLDCYPIKRYLFIEIDYTFFLQPLRIKC